MLPSSYLRLRGTPPTKTETPIPPEGLCEQLAAAAQVWDEKADEKALDGDATNHALYQATAEGMRQAIHAVEDNPESIMEHPGWVKTA